MTEKEKKSKSVDLIEKKRAENAGKFKEAVSKLSKRSMEVLAQELKETVAASYLVTHDAKLNHASRSDSSEGVYCAIRRDDGYVHSLSVNSKSDMPDDYDHVISGGAGGANSIPHRRTYSDIAANPQIISTLGCEKMVATATQVYEAHKAILPIPLADKEVTSGNPTVAFLDENGNTRTFTLIPSAVMTARWKNADLALSSKLEHSTDSGPIIRKTRIKFGTGGDKAQNVTYVRMGNQSVTVIHATRKPVTSTKDNLMLSAAYRGVVSTLHLLHRDIAIDARSLVSAMSLKIKPEDHAAKAIYKNILKKASHNTIAALKSAVDEASEWAFNKTLHGYSEVGKKITPTESAVIGYLRRSTGNKVAMRIPSNDEIEEFASKVCARLISLMNKESNTQININESQYKDLRHAVIQQIKEAAHV